MFCDVCWCRFRYFDMFWYVLICFDMFWYVLICFDMFWYMFDMFWYVLIYVWYVLIYVWYVLIYLICFYMCLYRYSWGLFFSTIIHISEVRGSEEPYGGLLDGFNSWTWLLVANLSCMGIVISLIMKYMDNIVKLFLNGIYVLHMFLYFLICYIYICLYFFMLYMFFIYYICFICDI